MDLKTNLAQVGIIVMLLRGLLLSTFIVNFIHCSCFTISGIYINYNKIIKHKMFEFTFSSFPLNTFLGPLHCGCFLDTLTVGP